VCSILIGWFRLIWMIVMSPGGLRHPGNEIFAIHLERFCSGYPSPYPSPTEPDDQPPIRSTISLGHSTARSLSRMECLNEWMLHSRGMCCFSHLLIAALAELDKHSPLRIDRGKRCSPVDTSVALLAAQRADPTRGTILLLPSVLSRRQG
jgi:hypothetical protein